VRYLLGTDALIDQLQAGEKSPAATIELSDLAVSAISFEWLLADIEKNRGFNAEQRVAWRANVQNFRSQLVEQGGQVLPLSLEALEIWGRLMLLDLHDERTVAGKKRRIALSAEERLVIATAIERGMIYLTPQRAWNRILQDRRGLAFQVA
jgi:hypothetical protein